VAEGPCSPAYLELWLAPLGAYRLLGGVPMDALTGQTVDLTDVLGTGSRRLANQLRDTPSWQQRFGLLDAYLLRRAQHGPQPAPEVAWAWRRLTATGGTLPIRRLAGEVGWSHKHLITRFRQQIGLPPKTAARLVRFDVVWHRLATHPPARTLGPARRRQRLCRPGAPDPRLPPVHRRHPDRVPPPDRRAPARVR
jgi:hypothetical protein